MSELERMFLEHTGRETKRYPHHMRAYDQYFSKFRNKEVNIMEIGSAFGGGLQLWKKYFGPKAHIYGLDHRTDCVNAKEDRIKIFIGEQEDKQFVSKVLDEIGGKLDVVIDDGGHMMKEQIASFEEIYLRMNDEAVYAVEDTHTSYRETHGGGYKKPGTFIEYCKNLIDIMHAGEGMLEKTEYYRFTWGIHFYLGAVIIEKSTQSRYGPIVKGDKRLS